MAIYMWRDNGINPMSIQAMSSADFNNILGEFPDGDTIEALGEEYGGLPSEFYNIGDVSTRHIEVITYVKDWYSGGETTAEIINLEEDNLELICDGERLFDGGVPLGILAICYDGDTINYCKGYGIPAEDTGGFTINISTQDFIDYGDKIVLLLVVGENT